MSIKSSYKSITSARRRVVLPPRINLVSNPSYEVNTTDSILDRYGVTPTVTFSQASDSFVYGSYSLKIVATDPADTGQYFRLALSAGSYIFSSFMKTTSVDNAHLIARQPGNGYATIGNEVHISGTTSWSQQTVNFTLTGDTEIDFLVGLGSYGPLSRGTVWFDGLMLENTSAVGSYFDGSYSQSGKTVSWNGTPHNSTSREIQ